MASVSYQIRANTRTNDLVLLIDNIGNFFLHIHETMCDLKFDFKHKKTNLSKSKSKVGIFGENLKFGHMGNVVDHTYIVY